MTCYILLILYLYCTALFTSNNNKRTNLIFYEIKVPFWMKYLLNPFKKNNEFAIISIIFELYAHISVISLLIYNALGILERYNYTSWEFFTISILGYVGFIFFIFDLKEKRSMINRILNVILSIILLLFGLLLMTFSILNL